MERNRGFQCCIHPVKIIQDYPAVLEMTGAFFIGTQAEARDLGWRKCGMTMDGLWGVQSSINFYPVKIHPGPDQWVCPSCIQKLSEEYYD